MEPRLETSGRDILDVCRQIQLECADLFHYLADIFIEDKNAFMVWKRWALECENSARKYPLMAKYRRQEPLGAFTVNILEVEIALIYVQSLARRVKSDTPAFREALELAVELERKLRSYRLDNLVRFRSESHASFFTALAQPHADALAALQSAHSWHSAGAPSSGSFRSPTASV